MNAKLQPLVTILTPVYNGEPFLAECIESILNQTHTNFEYIIVNNCSKDRTLDIASAYARKDPRVRVHDNEKFVGVIANHNIAFSLTSPKAKYVKVVSADDAIFPDCIARLVQAAEAHPSAGIIGCYQQSGKHIRWQGFPYPKTLIPGRELCKQILLSNNPSFGFGTPTSLLYRADLVGKDKEFYPNPSAEGDTSACFKALKDRDFAFVYQVLCYERVHEETQTSKSRQLNRYASSCLRDLLEYGPFYLSKEEQQAQFDKQVQDYYRFLASSLIGFKGKAFWDYHRDRFKELGLPLRTYRLLRAGMTTVAHEAANPGRAMSKFRKLLPRKNGIR
jgi:glycosyltransferase involved in cell wall biosynthesis